MKKKRKSIPLFFFLSGSNVFIMLGWKTYSIR